MSVHPTPATVVDHSPDSATETALTFLRHHRDFMERERRTRLYFVRLARERGLSYQAIGEALGMTEAGVRKLLERGD